MQKVMRRDPVTLPLKMSMTEAQRAMTAKQHYLRPMVGVMERTPAVAVRERLQGYEDAEARVEAVMVLYLERARAGTFACRTFEDMSAKRTSMMIAVREDGVLLEALTRSFSWDPRGIAT